MSGQFRGDFTRDTFAPFKHFARVLMQQGRVQLDADWNEQASILLHYIRTLGKDLVGPFGASSANAFFLSTVNDGSGNLQADFWIQRGDFYVDGILCELDTSTIPVVLVPAGNQVLLPTTQVAGVDLFSKQATPAQPSYVSVFDAGTPGFAPILVPFPSGFDGKTLSV